MKRIALVIVFLVILSCRGFVFSQDDKNKKELPAMEEQVAPDMNVVNNKLTITNAPVGKRVGVFNIIGNKVRDIQITSSEFETELNLPRAIYIFKMEGTTRKFIVK